MLAVPFLSPKVLDNRNPEDYSRHVSSTLTAEKVRAALIATDGSPTKAAALLGVSRQTVHAWMRKHDIRVERRVVVTAVA
jgi:transcriptional regulator of acetoin/glycerol metabolism